MKRLLIALSLGAAVLLSQSAFADGRHHSRSYERWGTASYRHSGADYNRFRFYNDRYHNGRYYNDFGPYRRSSFVSISYGSSPWYFGGYRGRGYQRHAAGDFLGGLVLGSLLSNSYQSSDTGQVAYRSTPRTRQAAINRRNVTRAPSGNRRLLRDLQGNCYEISRTSTGDELRKEVDPGHCDF